jgi:hypothetical protein
MEEIDGSVRIPDRQHSSGIPMLHICEDEQELRRRACAALHAEVLPRDQPQRTWGGRGSGDLCPVCGHAIEPAKLEVELVFADGDGESAVREFHMHLPCFAAWEIARTFAENDRA